MRFGETLSCGSGEASQEAGVVRQEGSAQHYVLSVELGLSMFILRGCYPDL